MKKHMTKSAVALVLATAVVGVVFAAEDENDEREVEIKLADAPAAVQEALKREAKGAAIEKVLKDVENGRTVYEGTTTVNGKRVEIEIAADGKVLETEAADDEGDDHDADDEDEDEDDDADDEGEVEMSLSDAPAAVQKALQDHAQGAKIDEVEAETEDGETVYEAEVTIDGVTHEVKVTADGTVLSDEVEDEDEDDDGAGDDD